MANPSYGDAIWVVMMISLSKLILMSFGCGPAILATSKFYKITLPLGGEVFDVHTAARSYIAPRRMRPPVAPAESVATVHTP